MWREVFLVLFCAIFNLFYVSATRCPHGWVEGPMRQKCYLFAQNHLKNWEEARYTCQSMRAELISIEDDTEMSWIKQELRQIQKTSTGGNKEWWMSLQKREVEINDTRWFWQSGVELDNMTVRWGQGEPNNYQQSEFCAEICCPHFLNDINCAQKINYICELDKETSPLTCDADNQWEYYNGTCYKFVQKFKNWKDAVTDCEDLDSALASVSDQLSFHSVATMASFREMDAWLGMYSINEEYFYLNETEAPMVESFMAKKTYRSIKRCIAVNNTITYPTKSLYPDSCRSAKPYICQKPEGICKDGYIQHQSMCYYISGSKMRRAHAETVCLIQKSRLVEIDSASKSSFLVNILKKEEVDEIWIGLKKQGNIWYWGSTGEQPALNRWAVVGQDNNQTMYDCSYMDIRNDGAWNKNYDCDTKLRFVCEIPVVTSFTTEPPSTTSTTTVSTTRATTQTTVPVCDLESCNDLYDQAVMLENHSPVMSQAARNFSETLHCISLRTRLQCIYKQSDLCRGHFQYQTQTDGISNQMNRLRCSNKTGAAVFDPITMRKECRMDILGLEYRGTKSTTSTGRTCQSWAKDQPHEHSLHSLYDQQNYCRNPDREPYGPWCYTIDPNQRWEYCDVPYCVGAVTPTTTPTTTTIVTTTTEYKAWSENCGMFWEDSVIPDVCYHFDQTMVDWMTAETACETLGGALISITSLQEQHYISGVIKSSPISSYWIGANSRGSEEGWRWSDGAPFALLHWMPDQPNGADNDEDCVSIDTEIGQWEDKTCDVQMGYICKKSVAPPKPPKIPPKSPSVGKNQMYGCPEGWVSYQTNCYLIARNKTTWTGARSICRKNGGDLVSITDEGEQDYLTSQIPSKMCFNIHSNDSSCESWAKRGECSNNPVWMARNCHLSCNLCIENCRNLHTSYECDHWASVGECSQNPTYMLKNCALSCGVCDGAIYGGFWIGLNDYKYQMAFEWSDDEDVAFTKWAKGEPNNWNGETHEDCVIMLLKNGLWNDASCSSVQSGFICKKRKQVIDKVTESPLSVGCVNNTIGYDAYCYGINDDPSDWPTAENTCSQATYGHLATINDRHVHLFLASQLVFKAKQFWIGLKQDYDTGLTDTWSSGLPVLYTAWGRSHTGSMDEDGLCVAMTTSHPKGSWVTVNCSSAMGYICEYPREGFTTSTTTTTTEAPQFCPPSFTEYNGYCYIAITNEKLTWMKSRDYCRDLGADLISIHSEEENRWFRNNLFRNYYRNDIWIGLNDRDSEKGFQWSDGSPTDFMSWLPFEPNDIYKYEDCVMTNKYSNGWNDDNCYKPKNFVCKIQKGMPLMKRNITEETEYCDGDKEWIYFEKNCYYISKFYFLRAKEAEEECFKKKSHLLSIHSQSENDFILENIHVKTDAWIGLNTLNIHNLGSFSWSDLTPLDFVQWKKGEPYPTDNKKCVKYQASTGRWFTSNCFKRAAYYICKKKNGTEYIGTPPPLPPLYGGCMPGFIRSTFNNKCYRLYTDEKKTWLEAWKLCSKKGKGYSLLSISNELEQMFISSLLVDVHDKVWIALTDEHSYNKYYWNDGTKLTYTNWHSKEPNGYSEHCGDIFIEPDKFGTWNDERCSVDLNYICQGQQDIGLDIDENTDDCPPGYTAYRNSEKEYSCFKLFTTASDWNTSRADCLKDGGDLASVRNQAEHSFVRYFLYNKTSSPIWIGLTNTNSKDDVTYKWSSAWPLVYTSWNPDKLPSKPCITVDTEFWSDENCETELPYLCKIDSEQPPQPSDNGTCFDGGFVNHDKCFYIFLHNPVSWTEARSLCESSSLTLASIQNLDQIEFLLNLMKQLAGIKLKIWIGLNKRDKYRYGWSWVNGSNSDFRNWNSGEPSTSFHDLSEDCVEMRPDGTWNDINCDRYEKPYICMSDKVQTTTLPPTATTIKQTTITKDTVIPMETTEKLERTSNKPVIVPNKEQARRKQTQNQTETLTAGQIIGILIGIVGALLIMSCIVFIIHFNKQKGASKTNNRSFVNALYLKTTEEISDDPTRMGSTVKICGTDTL